MSAARRSSTHVQASGSSTSVSSVAVKSPPITTVELTLHGVAAPERVLETVGEVHRAMARREARGGHPLRGTINAAAVAARARTSTFP